MFSIATPPFQPADKHDENNAVDALQGFDGGLEVSNSAGALAEGGLFKLALKDEKLCDELLELFPQLGLEAALALKPAMHTSAECLDAMSLTPFWPAAWRGMLVIDPTLQMLALNLEVPGDALS